MKNGLFYRSFELDRASFNKEERSVEVSFSSEHPVRRWFGAEILLHGDGNVSLARLKGMGAALLNHNPGIIIGKISGARIEAKRGLATIVFDDDDDGNKAMRKVESGSLRGVSVGYSIEKFREVRKDEEWEGIRGPAYVATRWAPYEISLTPVPADHTVGVGRDATRSLDGISIERAQGKEQDIMTLEELRAQIEREREESGKRFAALETAVSGLPGQIAEQLRKQQEDAGKPKMRITPDEYGELLSRASALSPEAVVKFAGWAAEGHDARAIQGKLLDLVTQKSDAKDSGGTSGVPDKPESSPQSQRTLKDMDDDTFIRGLTSPAVTL